MDTDLSGPLSATYAGGTSDMPPSTHPFHSQRETAEMFISSRYSAARYLDGAVAQLGERLLCKQEVIGSIPFSSTSSSGFQGTGVRDQVSDLSIAYQACARMTVYRFACRVLAPDIRACSSVG